MSDATAASGGSTKEDIPIVQSQNPTQSVGTEGTPDIRMPEISDVSKEQQVSKEPEMSKMTPDKSAEKPAKRQRSDMSRAYVPPNRRNVSQVISTCTMKFSRNFTGISLKFRQNSDRTLAENAQERDERSQKGIDIV